MKDYRDTVKEYQKRNQYICPNGALLFGGTFMTGVHTGELSQYFEMDIPIYNRSVDALSVFDAPGVLADCVYALHPAKLFINLGETDLASGTMKPAEIIAQYEWLLYEIHARLPDCHIYLVSLCADKPSIAAFNELLRKTAHETGCTYIDISLAKSHIFPEAKAFSIINSYIPAETFTAADAFCLKQI